jgi:hypothetical protein
MSKNKKRWKRHPQPRPFRAAPQARDEGGCADLEARRKYFNECYARFADFFGLEVLRKNIIFYQLTVTLHCKEQEVRRRVLDEDTVESYRWQVSPSIALRAARAAEQASERYQQALTNCRDAALAAVEGKFGPAPGHDAAVTEEATAHIPWMVPEPEEAQGEVVEPTRESEPIPRQAAA